MESLSKLLKSSSLLELDKVEIVLTDPILNLMISG